MCPSHSSVIKQKKKSNSNSDTGDLQGCLANLLILCGPQSAKGNESSDLITLICVLLWSVRESLEDIVIPSPQQQNLSPKLSTSNSFLLPEAFESQMFHRAPLFQPQLSVTDSCLFYTEASCPVLICRAAPQWSVRRLMWKQPRVQQRAKPEGWPWRLSVCAGGHRSWKMKWPNSTALLMRPSYRRAGRGTGLADWRWGFNMHRVTKLQLMIGSLFHCSVL